MTFPRRPENIKSCPECGTNLSHTARRCAVCGYSFTEAELSAVKAAGSLRGQPRLMPVSFNLPLVLGLFVLLLAVNALVIYGLQTREVLKNQAAAEQATAAYIATIYVSPTVEATPTYTRAPTFTPIPIIEYTVVEGDSCISIADRFNIYVDSLLQKNDDLDCAMLNIGTVLVIPPPEPTPEPTGAAEGTPAP